MEQFSDIKQHWNGVRRRWWLVVLLTAITGAAAFFGTPRSLPTYQSSTTLVFERQQIPTVTVSPRGDTVADRSLATQVELIRSPQVLRLAAMKLLWHEGQLGTDRVLATVQDLEKSIFVYQMGATNLLTITATAPSPELAMAKANAVAEAYIQHTTEEQARTISRNLEMVSRQIQALQEVTDDTAAIQPQQLQAVQDRLAAAIAELGNNIEDMAAVDTSQPSQALSERLAMIGQRLELAASNLDALATELGHLKDASRPVPDTTLPGQAESNLLSAADALDRARAEVLRARQHLESRLPPVAAPPEGGQVGPPPEQASINRLSVLEQRLLALASDVRVLVEDMRAAGLLSGAEPAAVMPILDRAKALQASVSLVSDQIKATRTSESNPLVYAALIVAEEQMLRGGASLSKSTEAFQKMTAPPAASPAHRDLTALEALVRDSTSTIRSLREEMAALQAEAEKSQPVPRARLSVVRDRLAAASSILSSAAKTMAGLRANENNLDTYARIVSAETSANALSAALSGLATELSRLTGDTTLPGDQWLAVARERTESTRARLDQLLQQVSAANKSDQVALQIERKWLADTATSTRDLARELDVVATQLDQADAQETDPRRFTLLLTFKERNQSARAALEASAGQLEQLGRPSISDEELQSQLLQFQRQLEISRLINDASAAKVLDPAVAAVQLPDTRLRTNTLIGIVVGLLLGVLAAVGLEYMDRRVRSPTDVKQQFGTPALGLIPVARGRWNPHPQVHRNTPPTAFSEAFRMLRSSVAIASEQSPVRVLGIASANEKEGKTTVAVNLARTLAMENRKVLLVDANLRKPDVASAFNLKGVQGLAKVLAESLPPQPFILEMDGVHILPAGQPPANPADLVSLGAMKRLLEQVKSDYDIVVLDCPALLHTPEAMVLARCADATLLVLRANRTTYQHAQQGMETLEGIGARVLGTILNLAKVSNNRLATPKGATNGNKVSNT